MQGFKKEFKKCSNGHYYNEGLSQQCPFCSSGTTSEDETKTATGSEDPTVATGDGFDDKTQVITSTSSSNLPGASSSTKTQFGFDVEIETPSGGVKLEQQYRSTRKLVGWLVTYSFDAMGVDYKLYEGRNIIGRDADCNITVNDKLMSGKHATLLFRSGKYSLTDSQSSHGTFVNDTDIDLEPHYIKDGDIIRMGETTFKFRTSL
ncbi:peptide-binding protein [Bacteroidia bacterium]|nr:peptide-binding protein [Bacteroidia bacterium]